MKRVFLIALSAMIVFAGCGSSNDEPTAATERPKRPPQDYFVWSDPGIAGGNFDADYADCQAQVSSDPVVGDSAPQLVIFSATVKCMVSKGWKAVDPDAASANP